MIDDYKNIGLMEKPLPDPVLGKEGTSSRTWLVLANYKDFPEESILHYTSVMESTYAYEKSMIDIINQSGRITTPYYQGGQTSEVWVTCEGYIDSNKISYS